MQLFHLNSMQSALSTRVSKDYDVRHEGLRGTEGCVCVALLHRGCGTEGCVCVGAVSRDMLKIVL